MQSSFGAQLPPLQARFRSYRVHTADLMRDTRATSCLALPSSHAAALPWPSLISGAPRAMVRLRRRRFPAASVSRTCSTSRRPCLRRWHWGRRATRSCPQPSSHALYGSGGCPETTGPMGATLIVHGATPLPRALAGERPPRRHWQGGLQACGSTPLAWLLQVARTVAS